ncbi:MAG: 50S ribosomal protein L15 [Patescibacteria group bacterium]
MNNIKAKEGQKKTRRVGRGHGSGRGCYSGKGQKGQHSRAGVSGLKRLGMRPRILQTPKLRGFNSIHPKNQVVSIEEINANFKDGDKITANILLQKGLIKRTNQPVKILGKDRLTVKVEFKGIKLSKSVK